MDNLLERRRETNPGIGESGLVFCPFMKCPCMKHGCELWVELTYNANSENERKVGRCSVSWLALLSTETRAAIDRLKQQKEKDEKDVAM